MRVLFTQLLVLLTLLSAHAEDLVEFDDFIDHEKLNEQAARKDWPCEGMPRLCAAFRMNGRTIFKNEGIMSSHPRGRDDWREVRVHVGDEVTLVWDTQGEPSVTLPVRTTGTSIVYHDDDTRYAGNTAYYSPVDDPCDSPLVQAMKNPKPRGKLSFKVSPCQKGLTYHLRLNALQGVKQVGDIGTYIELVVDPKPAPAKLR